MILAHIAIAVAAYFLGSIPVGYLLVRIFRRQDIRSVGSGNIGATNVLRFGGKGLGTATFFLDVLKGSAAVWLGGALGAWLMPAVPLRDAQALAALCAVLGHMFTCLAAFSWRQRRGHRIRRLSCRFTLGRAGRHRRLCHGLRSQPLRFAWAPSLALRGFHDLCLVLPARPEPARSSIAVECIIALLIIVKHHQISAACSRAPKPASEQKNPHESHYRPRFRRMGNRHRALAPPPRRPPGRALGAHA